MVVDLWYMKVVGNIAGYCSFLYLQLQDVIGDGEVVAVAATVVQAGMESDDNLVSGSSDLCNILITITVHTKLI